MSMLAAVLTTFGAPLEIQQLAVPTPRVGEVLVRVKASGVNPLDIKIRNGMAAHAQTVLPAVLGMDMAGVVESVGPGVDNFRCGDEVFGMTGGVGGIQGTLAQFAAVDHRLLAVKPRSLSMQASAALPLAFITASEALNEQARVRRGERVLVHGGAGGVGYVGIQLARHLGADVYATGSPASQDAIGAAGATAIDYTATAVTEYVAAHTAGEGFDVVFDTVGGPTLDDSFAAIRRYTGRVVSALGWGTHSLAPLSFRAGTYAGVFTLLPLLTGDDRGRHARALRIAAELADRGELLPRLAPGKYTLANLNDAYDAVEKRTAAGRVVVNIDSPTDCPTGKEQS